MTITLLFFGAVADASGVRKREAVSIDRASVGNVIEQLTQEYPALTRHKLLVALNEEYVSADTAIKDGDTLAVFTAVSGG